MYVTHNLELKLDIILYSSKRTFNNHRISLASAKKVYGVSDNLG